MRAGAGRSISASKFTTWVAGQEGGLVAVTTSNGEATTLTAVDTF